jgi:PhzF family phenazine biosynthesis protein
VRFKQVDVFTDRPFRGNPVAVVIGAEGLDGDAMQRIARWTNLSETTFLLKSTKADYRLRIFSPGHELPFAGHPTVGSAHAALESGFVPRKKNLTQECGAGIIALSVEDDGRIFVTGPKPKMEAVSGPIPSIPTAGRLIKFDVGPIWVVGEVSDARALAALKPDMTALGEWTQSQRVSGVTVFAASGEPSSAIRVRSFAPAQGIPEDPVCGTGNISVAAWLREHKRVKPEYVARQGMQMGREGQVTMRVGPDSIQLGGHAVTTVDGEIAC